MEMMSPKKTGFSADDDDDVDLERIDVRALVVSSVEGESRKWWTLVLAGQLLSVCLTATGTFSQLLANKNINIPTSQSFANYLFLSIHCVFAFKEGFKLQIPWWKYFIIALADVEGNFLLVKAYQYTTITSVQLLDCFTIPCVMLLSRWLLHTKYNSRHFTGCMLCLVGLGLLVYTDFTGNRFGEQQAENVALGDSLVLAGCVCYAISNIGQEYVVKEGHRLEFLAMLGVFGSVISGVQIAILERNDLKNVNWNDGATWGYLIAFSLALLALYLFVPMLLQKSSAMFLNLSLLTSDFWSLIIAIQLFSASLNWLYFIAFSIIIGGLVLYSLADTAWGAQLFDQITSWFRHRVCRVCCASTPSEHFLSPEEAAAGGEGDDVDAILRSGAGLSSSSSSLSSPVAAAGEKRLLASSIDSSETSPPSINRTTVYEIQTRPEQASP